MKHVYNIAIQATETCTGYPAMTDRLIVKSNSMMKPTGSDDWKVQWNPKCIWKPQEVDVPEKQRIALHDHLIQCLALTCQMTD